MWPDNRLIFFPPRIVSLNDVVISNIFIQEQSIFLLKCQLIKYDCDPNMLLKKHVLGFCFSDENPLAASSHIVYMSIMMMTIAQRNLK